MDIVSKSKKRYLANEKINREILKVAFKLFNSKGYKGTTTAEIARNANINEPTLYKHFSSKKELYLQCINIIFEEIYTTYNPIFTANFNDELKCIKELVEATVVYIKNETDKSKFIFQLMSYQEEPEFKEFVDTFLKKNIKDIEKVIKSAKKKKIISAEIDTHFLASYINCQYFALIALNEVKSLKEIDAEIITGLVFRILEG